MSRRDTLLLALLGLAVVLVVAAFQEVPGYMDADYYYAGGMQLAAGNGFTEPYLWNYLDDPQGLPHPSHSYWMPLASILSAIFPAIFGTGSWFITRIPFFLLVACLPPVTASLSYTLTTRRNLALTSGLLAVFPGFYLPFLATSDTFAIYMLIGGVFFLIISRRLADRKLSMSHGILLGFLAGLMHLSRADGLLWLGIALLVVIFLRPASTPPHVNWKILLMTMVGYLVVMGPWFIRNFTSLGSLLAPGGSKMLWLTSYDQIFTYPADGLTFSAWWQSGMAGILQARLWALGLNAANAFAVQAEIFLLPFILLGLWHLRKSNLIRLAVLTWILTFTAMTLVFPFAGARGGFFHSGAALQTVWWAVVPIGVERFLHWGREHRGWREEQARPIFLVGVIGLAVVFTISILFLRIPSWGQESLTYSKIDTSLVAAGKSPQEVVIVSNPPGFHLASSSPAIAVPDGNLETILQLSQTYDARYLILEEGSIPAGLMEIYEHPQAYAELEYLGEVDGARVFVIEP